MNFRWRMKLAFFSSSDVGDPVYIKRGTLFFLGHWALVIDDREYHLVSEDGRPRLKNVLHKTGHLPDTHGSFTGKYFIGWSKIDKTVLREKLKQIEEEFGEYKFGENDCRTFVALACEKVLDGHLPIFSPSLVIWLPLYLCGIWLPRYSLHHTPIWPFSLMVYGFADATLLQLSFHLMQTLTDGQYSPCFIFNLKVIIQGMGCHSHLTLSWFFRSWSMPSSSPSGLKHLNLSSLHIIPQSCP